MLSAALLDVGGTLWPERLAPALVEPTPRRLRTVLPDCDAELALATLHQHLRPLQDTLVQDTHAAIARALRELHASADPVAVRRALCEPAIARVKLFVGAAVLLQTLRD